MTDYRTVELERDMPCDPARLFALMTDPRHRAAWIAPDDSSEVVLEYCDCRTGGREETRSGPKEAPDYTTTGHFHLVTPDFLSMTEVLTIGGEILSVSLCGQEIAALGSGSRLTVTLQVTSLAGPELFDDYAGGWSSALDSLAALAAA